MKKFPFMTGLFALFLITFLIACTPQNDIGLRDIDNNEPERMNFGPDDFTPYENDRQRDEFRFFTYEGIEERRTQRDYNPNNRYNGETGYDQARGTEVEPDERDNQQQSEPQSELNDIQNQVVALTNEEREKNGLEPLKIDQQVTEVAQEKSEDMSKNNYFSHTSPTYGSPFDMMKQFGVDYTRAAENIAAGQRTPESVVDGWMNSEGHRRNILNGQLTHIGVGYAEDGSYWTQMFIRK